MLDQSQITEWKLTYGDIYSAEIRGVEYIFRALTFTELDKAARQISDDWSSADTEEFVVKCALLHPSMDGFAGPAGVISVLSDEINAVSGFGSPRQAREILDTKRASSNEVLNLMKAYVIATMPAYKIEDLDQLNFAQLAAKVAMAEQIINIQQAAMSGNQVTLEIIDPEEEAAKKEREKSRHAATKKPGTAGYGDPIAQRLRAELGG